MIDREHDTHNDPMVKVVNAVVVIPATSMQPEFARQLILTNSQDLILHFCSSSPDKMWPVVMPSVLAGLGAAHSQPVPYVSANTRT